MESKANHIPEYFSFMKPVLPVATDRYEIRNPSFHASALKHKFAECSVQYCQINQLNSESCFGLLIKLTRTRFIVLKCLLKVEFSIFTNINNNYRLLCIKMIAHVTFYKH